MSVDLKFYKRMKEEFIDQNKLTKFDIICLFLMATYKEKDLCECQRQDGYINWGEIERFSRFGIDFTHLDWIQDLISLPDDDARWVLENKIQDVAKSMLELYEMLENNGN